PQARLLGPSTAAIPPTTCTSTANTSARIPIRPSAPRWRVTPASSNGSPSQVAAAGLAARHLSTRDGLTRQDNFMAREEKTPPRQRDFPPGSPNARDFESPYGAFRAAA